MGNLEEPFIQRTIRKMGEAMSRDMDRLAIGAALEDEKRSNFDNEYYTRPSRVVQQYAIPKTQMDRLALGAKKLGMSYGNLANATLQFKSPLLPLSLPMMVVSGSFSFGATTTNTMSWDWLNYRHAGYYRSSTSDMSFVDLNW